MIVEKPAWVSHGVLPIFSIDIQPGGQRFATAGGDHKVRIWHMLDLSKETEPDGSTLTLLATIRDHFGSVNCVRWAKHGRHIASGSDDKVIHIHEKKPGSGTTEFGSGEPPDVENWKLVTTLRGHTADVVDLNWSPDDSMVASCSLDNTIHIWGMTDASTLAVLRGHTSLVKGISWDPIGSFLASQSDDKSVIIWRTSDWSLEHKTEGHWGKTVGSTFFRRLGWSPCGHFITTTHGFQKPHHSAPVLERGDWSATFDFLGHNAPVIAVKFNHSMFRKHHRNGSEPADLQHIASNERANGAFKSVAKDMIPYNVIAMGSQDCSVTVWTTASPRPIFVGKHFFQQSIVDLSWSPDGYSLFCCSLDGTIAAFHFQAKELGYRISDSELDELKRSRYGDVRGRQTSLAESPAQLLLEAAAAKQFGSKKLINSSLRSNLSGKVQATDGTSVGKHVPTKISDGEVVENNRVSNTLPVSSKMAPPKVHSPVKQKEYRRPDGRKRIIPEAVGVPVHQEHGSEGKSQPPHDAVIPNPSARNNDQVFASAEDKTWENGQKNGQKRPLPYTGNEYPNKLCNTETETTVGTTARAGNVDSLTLEVCRNSAPKTAKGSFSQTEAITVFSSERAKPLLSIHVNDAGSGSESVPTSLEAKPSSSINFMETSSATQPKETELICYKGSTIQWQDKLSGKAAVLTGNCNFWAVGCEDGTLQVYTKCGRRALPTMMVGSTPMFIDCDNGWKLLVVTQKGLIYVWDLFNWSCLLEDSLAPLVNTTVDSTSKDYGMIKVISAKFSRTGVPLVVLATRHAFLFHMTMKCWLRVADDCFPASNFSSSWPVLSGQGGELATLQADVGMFSMRNISWNRAMSEDATQTRAHLEAQLASALALRSPIEYRLHLLSYARCLTRETDEVRLREVCESLLGPPIGMIASSSSDAIKSSWDPFILGMKKHDLLKEVVLPAMASNRKVQRLLNEFVDLLSEYASKDPEEQAEKIDALDGNAI